MKEEQKNGEKSRLKRNKSPNELKKKHELESIWMMILDDKDYKKKVANPSVTGSCFTLMLSLLMMIFVFLISM